MRILNLLFFALITKRYTATIPLSKTMLTILAQPLYNPNLSEYLINKKAITGEKTPMKSDTTTNARYLK